ncbi:cytochrome-c peroxidase [Bradyrhizobium genosp. A]|uniref:cytochrome-c peroxidase n=1 Tax=Bradyrhizobium genosp. A TaxID=83626 RepID=UPI003CF31F07
MSAYAVGRALLLVLLGAVSLAVARTAAQNGSAGLSRPEAYARAAALDALGRKLFADPSLSASGHLACATCHDPQFAYGPPDDRDVQLGGKTMREAGLRAVPSLKYLQAVPQFAEHYYESDDEGDASVDNGPTGGLTWDGRVDRRRDQARVPLLSPFEMANDAAAFVVAKVRKAGYSDDMRRIFGDAIFDDSERAFAGVVEALEVYQQNAAEFYPYSSRYDAYLAGRAQLSPQEMRGLALFNDPAKGNCASCHRSAPGNDGTPPQFTDYGLIAIGVPRNRNIAANADPNYYDLGACGPLRSDLAGRGEFCGLFRTPSLRNVARRKTFFHNGRVHSLHEAVAFYVERDTNPDKWYPRDANGKVRKYDDVPVQYHRNINSEPPFGARPADQPALSASEIDDVVAFLKTLSDADGTGR